MSLNSGFRGRERGLKSLPLFGQEIAEVISVSREGGGDPSCSIIVHDGKRSQILYKCNVQADKTVSGKPSKLGSQRKNGRPLLLTGPYRPVSMDGCILIEFNMGDHCHAELLIDTDAPNTTYDEAVTKRVQACMCHPAVVVTYALLTNAVEANIEVKLLQQRDDSIIYGRIIARTDLGEVLLFESNDDNTLSWSSQKSTIIPLARSVLAVPITSSLTIEVDLYGHSNDEIVKGSVTSYHAHLKSNHVLHLDGKNGPVEVKIAWSD